MTIETLNILPICIGKDNIGVLEEWQSKAKNTKIFSFDEKGSYSENNLQEYPDWQPLCEKLLKVSQTWFNSQGYTGELFMTSAWLNFFKPTQGIENHTHPNSFISGCYYFENCSGITFTKDQNSLDALFEVPGKKSNFFTYYPSAGDVLVFKSDLKHEVDLVSQPRVSFGFNCFPKELGVLGKSNYIKIR